MKKIKIHQKVEEASKEREKKWKELRMLMEKNQGPQEKEKFQSEENQKINEVDEFLKKIGLERYSDLMKENGIDDLEILTELKESHLEEMGIVLGHRLKILKKIREINEGVGCTESSPARTENPNLIENSKKIENSKVLASNFKVSPTIKSPKSFQPLTSNKLPEKPVLNQTEQKGILKQPSPLIQPKLPISDIHKNKSPLEKTSQFIKTEEIFAIFKENPLNNKPKTAEKPDYPIKTQENPIKSLENPIKPAENLSKPFPIQKKSQETLTDSSPQATLIQKPPISAQGLSFPPKADNPTKQKEQIIQLSKPPIATKPTTVSKTLALYQPTSQELEKNLKLSELIPKANETSPNPDVKWDAFNYIPYQPSEEIRAASNKSSSRPNSAKSEKPKKPEKNTNFDIVGWDN